MPFTQEELIKRFGLESFSQAEQRYLLKRCVQLVSERLLPKVLKRLAPEQQQGLLIALRKESPPLHDILTFVEGKLEVSTLVEEEIEYVRNLVLENTKKKENT